MINSVWFKRVNFFILDTNLGKYTQLLVGGISITNGGISIIPTSHNNDKLFDKIVDIGASTEYSSIEIHLDYFKSKKLIKNCLNRVFLWNF